MSGIAYSGYELRRTFRNRRFLLFSLGFPVVFYFLVALPQRDVRSFGGTGLSVPLYYMIASWVVSLRIWRRRRRARAAEAVLS